MKKRIYQDFGLMGNTHALLAFTVYLLVFSFFKEHFSKLLGTNSVVVFVVGCIITTGFSVIPDLDSISSTIISVLGILGKALSSAMRSFASMMVTLFKSKKEDIKDPHRTFWHTLLASFFVGSFVLWTSSLNKTIILDKVGNFNLGKFLVALWIYLCFKLTLAGLLGNKYKRKIHKKQVKFLLFVEIMSVLISFLTLAFLPNDVSFWWLGVCAWFGYVLHLLGDMLTKQGVPLFFPFIIKGKFWWNVRVFGITTGGDLEKKILTPLCYILIFLSIIHLLLQ